MSNHERAFPVPFDQVGHGFDGMTLRGYFAAQAMQGILAADPNREIVECTCAQWAYRQADAMLAQREKRDE